MRVNFPTLSSCQLQHALKLIRMRDKLQQSSTCLFVLINYKNAFCSSSLPQYNTHSLKKHTNLFHKLTCHVSYVNIISPSIIFVNISNYEPILKPTFYALVVIKIAWLLPSSIIPHEMFLTWLVHCLIKKSLFVRPCSNDFISWWRNIILWALTINPLRSVNNTNRRICLFL